MRVPVGKIGDRLGGRNNNSRRDRDQGAALVTRLGTNSVRVYARRNRVQNNTPAVRAVVRNAIKTFMGCFLYPTCGSVLSNESNPIGETLPPRWFRYLVDREYCPSCRAAIGSWRHWTFHLDGGPRPLRFFPAILGDLLPTRSGYSYWRDTVPPEIALRPGESIITITVYGPGSGLRGQSPWGFTQLAMGATVYRYATWEASLRTMTFGAAAWVAAETLRDARVRWRFLSAFAWFGCALSLLSVVAYFTSRGRILWVFASPYPDVWGPFLSRNDFAGFMELSFPVALLLAMDHRTHDSRIGMVSRRNPAWEPDWAPARFPLWVPAWMLAAGLASGSRAGAILLLTEAGVVLALISPRCAAAKFVVWAAASRGGSGSGDPGRALRRKRSLALPARDHAVHFETDRGPSVARLRAWHLLLCLSGIRNFRYRRRG